MHQDANTGAMLEDSHAHRLINHIYSPPRVALALGNRLVSLGNYYRFI
jgi:hypothetical protein